MKVAVSFLKSAYDYQKTLMLIDKSKADYIHIDVMDGLFVNNKTIQEKEEFELLKKVKKNKDVHLMTLHLKSYIDLYATLNPKIITFHYEATTNPIEVINYIKRHNIKAGLAINPLTKITEIEPLLSIVDLVLIMSVTPGYGNQLFIPNTINKFNELVKIKNNKKYKFKISVDGGINADTIKLFNKKLNMAVSGSYICNSSDFDEKINQLKNPN